MATEALKRAVKKYDSANTTQFHLKLNNKTDADIKGSAAFLLPCILTDPLNLFPPLIIILSSLIVQYMSR